MARQPVYKHRAHYLNTPFSLAESTIIVPCREFGMSRWCFLLPWRGGSLRWKEPQLVPRDPVPLAELAKEWGKLKASESPKWSADKWRRVATVFGVEVSFEAGSHPVVDPDGRAA
jgi:hypothetical protein